MLEIALMIEGQNGLNWPRWQAVARLAEEGGLVGLFRSDHFTNSEPPDLDSLELWTSLTWLATHTERIEFGPLVTPFSFRHPVHTARMAAAVDDLSSGRLILGLGAGWNEREHRQFGFDLLEPEHRFDRFEEGMEVVTRLLQSREPVTFEGQHYQLREAILLPAPQRPGGPEILIGGNGANRTLGYVVRYAEEWNCVSLLPGDFEKLNQRLSGLLRDAGRRPESVRRSMMTACVFGRDPASFDRKMRMYGASLEEVRQGGAVAGSLGEIREQLRALEQAGLDRIMLQWLDLEDLQSLEVLIRGLAQSAG